VDEIWEGVLSKRNDDSSYGIPSKFDIFDDYFAYEPGNLYMIGGRYKSGKSVFLMNEAIHKASNDIPTLYFDTEMSKEEFALRVMSNISKVSVNKIKRGGYGKEEAESVESAKNWIKTAPLVHINKYAFSDDFISSTVQVLKNKMGIGFVVYDYVKAHSDGGAAILSAKLGKATDFLKNNVASRFNVPILSAVQLNRDDQVADSDKVKRYVNLFVKWREKTGDEIAKDGKERGNYCAQITENRSGAKHADAEYADFLFDGGKMEISQAAKQGGSEDEKY
jgi:replicative DNA helicase